MFCLHLEQLEPEHKVALISGKKYKQFFEETEG